MKIYISADIEGVAGVTCWNDTEIGCHDYDYFAKCMTKEVLAAVEAAMEMGATEIFINDAHDSGRNMKYDEFPKEVTYMRGWSGSPECMVEGADESFDAAMFIGYHSGAGREGNPLAHTMSSVKIVYYKINGVKVSEFDLHGLTLGAKGVPLVFVSGDEALCNYVKTVNDSIETAAVKRGFGNGNVSVTPKHAQEMIKAGVKAGLAKKEQCIIKEQENYEVEIYYKTAAAARRISYYPGAKKVEDHIIKFEAKTIDEVMRFNLFAI